jgi:hypothetical protein
MYRKLDRVKTVAANYRLLTMGQAVSIISTYSLETDIRWKPKLGSFWQKAQTTPDFSLLKFARRPTPPGVGVALVAVQYRQLMQRLWAAKTQIDRSG